jgi:Fur family peroxide stress response transcriptional regulator
MATVNKYRNLGLKLTPQRIAILDYLEGNTTHPSAEDIYKAVSRRFSTMSLATVYTTLAALAKTGNVLELTVDPDKKRYDPQTGNHDHLICISCKRIVDIPGAILPELPDGVKNDFTIIETHVEVYGLCPHCKTTANKAKETTHVRRS